MAAIIGVKKSTVDEMIAEYGGGEIEIANINTPTQYIVAGSLEFLLKLEVASKKFGAQYIPLNVSAAFHSRHMRDAHSEFARYLDRFEFADPKLHVISNSTARPYLHIDTGKTLGEQITNPVRWLESIQYLLSVGEENFIEIGPRKILTRMVDEIRNS